MIIKSILLTFFTLFVLKLHSQENKFTVKNYEKIDIKKFIELKKSNPKIKTISVFENGKIISKNDRDSISKNSKKNNRKQTFYRDTITNKFIIVNRELTKEEIKKRKIDSKDKLKHKKNTRKKLDGSTIKELSFEDINGKKYDLTNLKGKVIVLNFWFIHCKPCLAEFPDLNDLKKRFKSKPVEFFAITSNNKKSLDTFFKSHKLDFTIIPNGKEINNRFKIPYFPYHIIIDKSGQIEYIKNIKKLESKINNLL